MSLSGALRQVEEATPEGFEMRKRLVGLLVESISLGKSQQEGRGPDNLPFRTTPASDTESDELSMPVVKNGRESITPGTNTPTLTVVAVR